MHQFERYDPAQPRTVTSFKGNQKLIFEGYRYNIHHIRPAKGVKTWRCVCAKKLTCSRSWCKGRAETWDEDSQGVSRGEHNHTPEHEVAELEYFKSQLILAAIESPNASLNDLIDEAAGFMSDGVSFGSRESLKKSLTVARKAAENGGFKLKCYKSTAAERPVAASMVPPEAEAAGQRNGIEAGQAKMRMSGNKGPREAAPPKPSSSPASAFRSPATSALSDTSSGFHSASASLNSSSASSCSASSSASSSSFLFAAVAAAAAAALNGDKAIVRKTSSGSSAGKVPQTPPKSCGWQNGTEVVQHQEKDNAEVVQRKKARVNSIFDRLSTKAAEAAAVAAATASESSSRPSRTTTTKAEVETQTDQQMDAEQQQRQERNGNVEDADDEGWRVVRICCCADKSMCTKGSLKRKWTPEMEADESGDQQHHPEPEESPPPSASSSVENQPHHHGEEDTGGTKMHSNHHQIKKEQEEGIEL